MDTDFSCPTCGARNMRIEMFDRPIFITFVGDDSDYKYCTGTYVCPVCSKDGMITLVRKAGKVDGQ